VLTAGVVYLLAQPPLRVGDPYEGFTPEIVEVRAGSADFQHVLNRGVYRAEPRDWVGRGVQGVDRYEGRARQVLHPGWVALALAVFGWTRRHRLEENRRTWGMAFLAMGLFGLVLAFGDSVGLPGTDRRLPLPLEWLRTVAPPFRAFRGAWRFSWLMVIAVAWWSAVGVEGLLDLKRRVLAPVAVALLALVSVPMGVPAMDVPLDGHLNGRLGVLGLLEGPVATLPAPVDEYAEDVIEALWLARALETGRSVTGGATGWVPPEIVALRSRLRRCEEGGEDPRALLTEWRTQGITTVEIALRPGDPRVDFWRGVLHEEGAKRVTTWPRSGYEMYLLP
jgi:hypothetical protein